VLELGIGLVVLKQKPRAMALISQKESKFREFYFDSRMVCKFYWRNSEIVPSPSSASVELQVLRISGFSCCYYPCRGFFRCRV
jgi:hypothetical protein